MDLNKQAHRVSVVAFLEAIVVSLAVAILIASCSRPPTSAVRQPLDLTTPWTMHVIVSGAETGLQGADGDDLATDSDGHLVNATAWEESGALTYSVRTNAADPWNWTTTIVTGMTGVEDAKLVDLDGDGRLDMIAAADGGARLWVAWQNPDGTFTPMQVASSLSHGHWMQAAYADFNGDGYTDIVAGSRAVNAGTGANAGYRAWFLNPGPSFARTSTSWAYNAIGNDSAGWTMSLATITVGGHPAVFRSDRKSYKDHTTGAVLWDLYGVSWDEWTLSGGVPNWTHHQTEQAGSCGTCTPGDEMFATVASFDGAMSIVDGTSSATTSNRVVIHTVTDWETASVPWPNRLVTPAAVNTNVGHYQGATVADFDGDGLSDLAITYWETDDRTLDSTASGVTIAHQLPDGSFERAEVSGPNGTKFDNALVIECGGMPCILTSEQNYDELRTGHTGGIGVAIYENPWAPPAAPDGPPDAAVDAPHECGVP